MNQRHDREDDTLTVSFEYVENIHILLVILLEVNF